MSTTQMLTGNALTLKTWSKKSYIDTMKQTVFGRMLQNGTLFYAKELNGAQKGDKVTFNFAGILHGIGLGEGGTLVGNEEALALNNFSMVINVLRHGVLNPNKDTIEQQRTNVEFDPTTREVLSDWLSSRVEASILNQLAGNTATSIVVDGTTYSGNNLPRILGENTALAPSSNRVIWAGGRTADENLTSADTFSLDMVDAALELIQRTNPTVKPIKRNGEDSYDLYISYEQLTDLKRDTSSKIQWGGIYTAAMTGGMVADNPIFTGGIGRKAVAKYANVYIIPVASTRFPNGVNSSTSAPITTVKRAILCGQNAGAYGSILGGRLSDDTVPVKFTKQLQDYEYQAGIEARMIWGVSKMQFTPSASATAQDMGSVVLASYGATHSY